MHDSLSLRRTKYLFVAKATMVIQPFFFFNFELFASSRNLLEQKLRVWTSLAMIKKSEKHIIIRIECGESN
jgi:hypothetical protein